MLARQGRRAGHGRKSLHLTQAVYVSAPCPACKSRIIGGFRFGSSLLWEVDESLSTVLDGQIGARGSVFRLYVDSEFRLLDQ